MIIFVRKIVYSPNIADLKVIRYKLFTFDFGQKYDKDFSDYLFSSFFPRKGHACEKILATPQLNP